MEDSSYDTRLRAGCVRTGARPMREIHQHLTAQQLGEGFYVDGQRYPMVNPQQGNL